MCRRLRSIRCHGREGRGARGTLRAQHRGTPSGAPCFRIAITSLLQFGERFQNFANRTSRSWRPGGCSLSPRPSRPLACFWGPPALNDGCSGANPPNINGANGTNTSTGNGILTIPIADGANVLANTPVRLRIISELTSVTGTITNACYNPFYAQAEDYQLIINQSNISVQKTYIPDDNFESYLETHDENGNIVSIGSVNSMGDGIANNDSVTTSNISFVDSLNINSQSIFDLSGIEDFSSLKELHCISNQLSNLDISQNNLLFEIECQFNQLNTLDLNNNTALIYLNCASNQITNLDVSSNTSLTLLECSSNLLTNLDISNNTSLTFLSCGQNQLDSLDVTQNAGLVTLI